MVKVDIERLTYLTEKVVNDEQLSADEAAELEFFLAQDPRLRSQYQERIERKRLNDAMSVYIRAKENWRRKFDQALSRGKVSQIRKRSIPLWQYYSASAAILLFLVAGLFVLVHRHPAHGVPAVPIAKTQDIKPGGNRAVLVLSNGKEILLDSAKTGLLSAQTSAKIDKTDSGQIAITVSSVSREAKGEDVSLNSLATPKGGQYKIVLSDGTKVWLNASSTLRFPSVFAGKERNVSLEGEGYFEVADNKHMPFTVSTEKMNITVLGTRFNIMTYADEPEIKTTVLDGAVKVQSGVNVKVLTPSQQARLQLGGELQILTTPNPDAEIAWKDGQFYFKRADIRTVMRQLARWYNADVEYSGTVTNHTYSASIDRKYNASEILKMLEASGGVHFEVENIENKKKIIVLP
jgi:ferric-dicitrate binding protein FerR (iron transport regulator)